ncbi:atherin-like [Pseudopipra pipra]|uniref:atherin-like n=1 Tax=Pseudopipra pipra TaxID=415032 RepID=UPI0031396597
MRKCAYVFFHRGRSHHEGHPVPPGRACTTGSRWPGRPRREFDDAASTRDSAGRGPGPHLAPSRSLRSFVPRPRGTKTSAADGTETPASPVPAPAPSPHLPAWPRHRRRLHRSRLSGAPGRTRPGPRARRAATAAPPPSPARKLPRTHYPAAAAPCSALTNRRLAPRPAAQTRAKSPHAAPLPTGTALSLSPHTVPVLYSPPLPLATAAHSSSRVPAASPHTSLLQCPRRTSSISRTHSPAPHMALPARGTDDVLLPLAHRATAPGPAFLGFQRSPARGGATTERAPLATGWAMRKEQSSR